MLILIASALLAQQAAEWNCDDPQYQQEMNACASIDFEQADRQLNALWPEAIAGARAADAEIDRQYDTRPGYEVTLREAQRAWVIFRDAHCTWQGYGEARGGSMEPMVYDGCRAELTRARIRELGGIAEER